MAQLQQRLEQRKTSLWYDPRRGYLPAVLEALDIPVSSQVLVFSKTSFQRTRISPATPRAIHFNDDVYVGFVQSGENTVVTFDRTGTYTFQVTIADARALAVTSGVNVTVNPVLTSIVVTSATVTLPTKARQQFTAQAFDPFSQPLASQPSFTWSKLSGPGAINKAGLDTAPTTGQGTAVVQAKAGGKAGQVTITIFGRSAAVGAHLRPRKSTNDHPRHKKRHV